MDLMDLSIVMFFTGCVMVFIGTVLAAPIAIEALRKPSSAYSRILQNKTILRVVIWTMVIFVCISPLVVSMIAELTFYFDDWYSAYRSEYLITYVFPNVAIISSILLALTLSTLGIYSKLNLHNRVPLFVKTLLLFAFFIISMGIIWGMFPECYLEVAWQWVDQIPFQLYFLIIPVPSWVSYVSGVCTVFIFMIVLYVRKGLQSI